jgi:hypothetical protein
MNESGERPDRVAQVVDELAELVDLWFGHRVSDHLRHGFQATGILQDRDICPIWRNRLVRERDDHGLRASRAEAGAHIGARHLHAHGVNDDDVGAEVASLRDGIGRVPGRSYLCDGVFGLERVGKGAGHRVVVLDEQDP